MKITGQTITISGLRFYAYHGVEPQERIVGAWYSVELSLHIQALKAIETDELAGTVNYASVIELVKEEMQIPRNLLEHLAGCIAKRVMTEFTSVAGASVTISKKNPPVAAATGSASFTIEVERD